MPPEAVTISKSVSTRVPRCAPSRRISRRIRLHALKVQLAAHRKPWQAGPQPAPLLPRLEPRAICGLSYHEPPPPTPNSPLPPPPAPTPSPAPYAPSHSPTPPPPL